MNNNVDPSSIKMSSDIWLTVKALTLLTLLLVISVGVGGGIRYLLDKSDIATKEDLKRPSPYDLSFDPLTKSEIELIERLKQSVDVEEFDSEKHKKVGE
jgi:hypothetical protein